MSEATSGSSVAVWKADPGCRFAHPGYGLRPSPFLVTRYVARDHPALVASGEKLVEHAVVPLDHVAAGQDAAVAGRDGLDVELVEDRADAAADRIGRRAFEPPVAGVEHEGADVAQRRRVVVGVGDDPRA